MNQQEEKKEFWAIVSLMGHQQLAGFLDEYTMGGCSFLRLTVPETPKQPQWTRLFKDNSIYAIDPCTEAVAKWKAERLDIAPIAVWDATDMLKKELEKSGKVIVSKDQLPDWFLLAEPAPANNNDDFGHDEDQPDLYGNDN